MHELSIVLSIVGIAQQQAAAANARTIEEIEIDIGCLSTIEMNAFEFAWQQGVKQTILEQAAKKINRIKGKAICPDCDAVFAIENVYDACPVCSGHLINIIEGKELRVRSLVVAEE
ncbi:hydrogenase maturation nickel metallochaperone HypA [Ferruginibacter sp. SUN106]|uniref:hydrogenase maturation nickel metallochaperone HypA/HybF n=1 Tax=Ferruginibacter sp. SUN106 TaxID=2978348 RepID=UPI003D35F484